MLLDSHANREDLEPNSTFRHVLSDERPLCSIPPYTQAAESPHFVGTVPLVRCAKQTYSAVSLVTSL